MDLRVERRADGAAVDRILRQLPDWFGDEDSIVEYVVKAATLPSYLAVDADGVVIGVALLKRHFTLSAEIHLIAIDPSSLRMGVGSTLLTAIERDMHADGARMLQVHTAGPSYPSVAYERTRAFYLSVGFIPLQEFDRIDWDGPTLILVKALRG